MRLVGWLLLLVAVLAGCKSNTEPAGEGDGDKKTSETKAADTDRPFLAIWQRNGGRLVSEAPYLRIAIWKDGRILFSKDPDTWGHALQHGQIPADKIAKPERSLIETGVFELKGTCYLVPDAPCDCVMLDLGEKKQMLYWDEVETAGYGINIAPKAHHVKFKECWKEINRLALAVRPEKFEEAKERFQKVPESWILKNAIQSE